MKQFTAKDEAIWQSMIGLRVWKNKSTDSTHNPNPFKSGLKVNTVTGIVKHPHVEQLGFTFAEDDSVVECWRCSIAPPNV